MRILVALMAALLAVSCGRNNIDNKEAVRKGVVDYLDKRKSQTGLDMSLMNVEVTNVTFEKNEARATVAFRAFLLTAGRRSARPRRARCSIDC